MARAPDYEVREAIDDTFSKLIYHSIVCIGVLPNHCDSGAWVVDALGAPHIGDKNSPSSVRKDAIFRGTLESVRWTFCGGFASVQPSCRALYSGSK
jgi:hypothetical protein